MKRRAGEFFYLDKNGRPTDEALHEPILAEGDEALAFVSVYEDLKRSGLADAAIAEAYGSLFHEMVRRGLRPRRRFEK